MRFASTALVAALCAAPALARAASLEDFKAVTPGKPDDGVSPIFCTADQRWCAEISRYPDTDESGLHIFDRKPPGPIDPVAQAKLPDEMGQTEFGFWPHVLRLDGGGLLIGVLANVSVGYSGGGGHQQDLTLFRVQNGKAKPVLTVTASAGKDIRACFSKADTKARLGACHDEFDFAGDLTLGEAKAGGLPDLVYETKASVYPADALSGDSTTRPKLRKSDLRHAPDPACTYRVTYRFKGGRYEPDREPPACDDYKNP